MAPRPFLRETNAWRLIGLGVAVIGLFAPADMGIQWNGNGVTVQALVVTTGMAMLAAPTIAELLKRWRG